MKNSLRTRSLLTVLLTLSLVLGLNTLFLSAEFISHQKKTLENKTKLVGENLRDQLSRTLNLGLPLDALEGVNESCRNVIESNKEIGYCMLVDTKGRVFYHNDPLLAGRALKDPASIKAAASTEELVQYRSEDDADYYDVSIPILNPDRKLLGSIRLGLKYDTVSSQIYPILWTSGLVALVTFILASFVVTMLVSRKIITPITDLSSSATLIAQGDLSRRLDIRSDDELGNLAASFNRMAESLSERETRIQQGFQEIEKANKELESSYRQLESTAMELEQKSRHLKEKVGELSFLHDATDRLRLSIELEDILTSVARDVTEGQGYDRVMVALVNEQAGTVEEKASIGFEGRERELFSEPSESHNILSAAVSERKVQYVAQAALDSRVSRSFADSLQLNEFAVIPMSGKDRCVGAILVDNRKSSRPMRKDKLDILATFASTAAMAVENAYLYRQLIDNLDTVEKANRELRKLDESKTNFLSLASHELRTPLVSVMGCLNMMLSEDLGRVNADQRHMMEIALKGANRLRDIIEDLLMVAKIEGGRLPMKLRWLSVADSVKAAIDEVVSMLGQRNVAIRTDGLDLLPKVEADEDRLHQCFTNLIGNAVKFTPDGGVVTVGGRKVKVDKDKGRLRALPYDNSILSSDTYIEVVVQDTGIGISKENLERIFDKFFEAGDVDSHSTGKVKFMGGGTGLGLSIVKGIVEGHNGCIWAESDGADAEKCPGSRFVMLLPMKQPVVRSDALDAVVENAAGAASAAPATSGAHRPKVLLIEDDDDIITFTRLILEKRFNVIVATDGFEGIRRAFSERPALVLLDVWMRGIDGLEVCRILKGSARTSAIPVAMFTAAAQKHEVEQGYQAGADDYITKPFTPAEITERVTRLVNRAANVA